MRKANINYSQRPIKYGVGFCTINSESQYNFSGSWNHARYIVADSDDVITASQQYQYVRIKQITFIQNNVNLTNQEKALKLYVRWGAGSEELEDLEQCDNTKFFKNIGRSTFTFVPPDVITQFVFNTAPDVETNRYVNVFRWNLCGMLYSYENNKLSLHTTCYAMFQNSSTIERHVRVIVTLQFRGLRVPDFVEASKIILRNNGYEILLNKNNQDKDKIQKNQLPEEKQECKDDIKKIISNIIDIDNENEKLNKQIMNELETEN